MIRANTIFGIDILNFEILISMGKEKRSGK